MNFEEAFARIQDLPGPCAEFGVFEGHKTFIMARAGRKVYAWDTFSGMPDDDYIETLDNSDPPGKWVPQRDVLKEINESGLDIIPIIGVFSKTIPAFTEDVKFAFVHVDCDHYHAYRRVLEFLSTRMLPGGIIKLDDYGCCAGAKKATDEWCGEHNHPLESGEWLQF